MGDTDREVAIVIHRVVSDAKIVLGDDAGPRRYMDDEVVQAENIQAAIVERREARKRMSAHGPYVCPTCNVSMARMDVFVQSMCLKCGHTEDW